MKATERWNVLEDVRDSCGTEFCAERSLKGGDRSVIRYLPNKSSRSMGMDLSLPETARALSQ